MSFLLGPGLFSGAILVLGEGNLGSCPNTEKPVANESV